MMDCIFCRILNKEIPSKIIYEDDMLMAFHDVAPQAPVHALIVPKKHITSLNACTEEDIALLGHVLNKIKEIAFELELANGYRLVCNCGEDGMQTVDHLHFHLLGKRLMGWPPG